MFLINWAVALGALSLARRAMALHPGNIYAAGTWLCELDSEEEEEGALAASTRALARK